jgi:hypothetical protein
MREILCDIAKRLGEIPTLSGELTKRRAGTSDSLHRNLDTMRGKEILISGEVAAERNRDGRAVFPNEAARQAEVARRLQADVEYQNVKADVDRLRQELRELDAQIEENGRRHRSDSNIVNLVASLLSAGMKDDAAVILAAYGGTAFTVAPVQQVSGNIQAPQDTGDGLETGTFRVLEVRQGRKPETIRAYVEECQDGTRVALYAKNGAGRTLAGAIGKIIRADYRRLDKGLYAVSVQAVA